MNLKNVNLDLLVNVIQTIPSCIFFKDKDLKYVFASHYWEQLEKTDGFDIYGKTDLEVRKDKENALIAMEADKKILETGIGQEYVIKSDIDNHIQYLEIKKEPVRDEENKIIGIVGLITEVTNEIEAKQRLEYLSSYDSLTNIRNRQSGTEEINKLIKEDNDSKFFCVFDLDDFKSVNDSYGHKVGDMILISFANAISGVLGENDIFCRIGGDEFVLLMHCSDVKNGVNQKIDKIFDIVDNIRIQGYPKIKVSVSMGITRVHTRDTFDNLYIDADKAMYKAKREKKNSYSWY